MAKYYRKAWEFKLGNSRFQVEILLWRRIHWIKQVFTSRNALRVVSKYGSLKLLILAKEGG